jgi:competence ComEA-like helix-hairpin-helix protein
MGIRSSVASLIGGDAVDARAREMVEEVLASKGYVRPADLQQVREQLAALKAGGPTADDGLEARLAALETEVAGLRKKLNMAMGAVQAATAQLADVRRTTDAARGDARHALARAESALATAESLSEGVDALEDAVERTTGSGATNINTASVPELEALPGIGPSMAVRIVADRDANGPFRKISDLSRVKGLGTATVKKLTDKLTV